MKRLKTEYIIVHHTASNHDMSSSEINTLHASQGWGGIGYHFVIRQDGNIETGKKITEVGAHCKHGGYNSNSVGIVLSGNFENLDPTSEQLKTLTQLVLTLIETYNLSIDKVLGHNETGANTLCPGKNLRMDNVRSSLIGSKFHAVSDQTKFLCKDINISGGLV